jgi:hypothetical protein
MRRVGQLLHGNRRPLTNATGGAAARSVRLRPQITPQSAISISFFSASTLATKSLPLRRWNFLQALPALSLRHTHTSSGTASAPSHSEPPSAGGFQEFGLHPKTVAALHTHFNIHQPSPIQSLVHPSCSRMHCAHLFPLFF